MNEEKKEDQEKEVQEFALSTKKSIHQPIVVKIDGKSYENNPLSRSLFDKVREYEEAAINGDVEALYKQVEILYSVPLDVLNQLDCRDVTSLLDYTMAKIIQSSVNSAKEKAEKNVSKPGPKEPASSPESSQAS